LWFLFRPLKTPVFLPYFYYDKKNCLSFLERGSIFVVSFFGHQTLKFLAKVFPALERNLQVMTQKFTKQLIIVIRKKNPGICHSGMYGAQKWNKMAKAPGAKQKMAPKLQVFFILSDSGLRVTLRYII
jgi:hypothetical protein